MVPQLLAPAEPLIADRSAAGPTTESANRSPLRPAAAEASVPQLSDLTVTYAERHTDRW